MSKISHNIKSQLTPKIIEDYPRFVEFLEAYYEWLQQEGNPHAHLADHLSYLDFTKSLESYTDQMKKEYLLNVPKEVLADPELFIKYSKQFYLSVGTKKSFNFIFNVLFGEDIELYYPKNDIFRLSDGKWVSNESIFYVTSFDNPERFINRRVVQEREVGPGLFEYAYATVIRAKNRFVRGWSFSELTVVDIEGEFDITYPVFVEGEAVPRVEYFLPVATDYEILSGGSNYNVGDFLSYGGGLYTFSKQLGKIGELNTKLTTNFNESDIDVRLNNTTLSQGDYNFDGTTLFFNVSTQIGDDVEIDFPQYTGFVVVDAVDVNNNNAIQSVDIVEPIIGIGSQNIALDTTDGGSGASVEVSLGIIKAVAGYFLNDDGWLSSTKVLQDGDFYQEYSYVIRSTQTIDKYRDVVQNLLHPAGMKFFGQISLEFLINAMIRSITFDITIRFPEILIESYAALGPTTSFLDRVKNYFDEESVRVENYKDVVVGDIITTPLKKFNAQDFKHRILS